ncbi:M48 family metalloprotease [Paralcaligenes sp. KSB-10]|uniref:M48 family metalloprotease n=1 Tax=Paralcaligenes sp. KSB-10 TaxID=2901142 RepID=UPI001E482186|nr:M48 family metalloprotease [Paralcaligenes sp. KSB-10]UHL62507.1 M48 family metalloprotease [Paralcaligenes sp. KSB-10]
MNLDFLHSRSISFKLCAAGLAAALVAPLSARSQPVGIPSMGAASSAELSPRLERTLGDAIMEQGRRDPTYIGDPEVSQYLTEMGRKLATGAPGGAQPITVFGVRDPEINAFALPGGYIGVNSGLVVSSQNESQLASVIAHEIGHVVQRHIARGMTQQSQNSGVMIASLVAALLAGLSGNGDLAVGVAAFGQAAAVDRQLGFSRQAEQEADRAGFEMLRKAGYDPKGMVQMFTRLMKASRLNEGAGGGAYASTHPLSIQRLSDIENRVEELPQVHYRDSDAFWYLRAQLRIMQALDRSARQDALRQLNLDATQQTGVRRSAAWYGIAYAAWKKNELSQAEAALQKAQQGGDNSPELARLSILLANSRGNGDAALKMAQSAWARWPDNQGIALAMVDVMQKNNRDKEALQFLAQRVKQWPELPQLHRLEAQSHERLGQKVAARRAMASYYEQTGALSTAVEQLQQARSLSSDFYTQSELDAQIRSIKQRLETERELLQRFKKP